MRRLPTLLLIVLAKMGDASASDVRVESNAQIWALFVEHEIGDGVHYSYVFKANNRFSGTEMARNVRGPWKVANHQICWAWIQPPGSEVCFTARKDGPDLTLFRHGQQLLNRTLMPAKTDPVPKGR